MIATIAYIIEHMSGILWRTVILTVTVEKDGYYILTVDNDGYYNIHHRTYLWYTILP
jgi:hypothetical protein